MSLLEDALRRQNATAKRSPTPVPSPVPRAIPVLRRVDPSTPPAPPPPAPPPLAPQPSVSHPRRFAPIILPVIILLLVMTVVWFALKNWQPSEGVNPQAMSVENEGFTVVSSPATNLFAVEAPPIMNAVTIPAGITNTTQESLMESQPAPEERVMATLPESVEDLAADSVTLPDAIVQTSTLPAKIISPPLPEPWPLFSVKGIAYGKEQIVMLDTGEMLAAGERSRTGVRVVRVAPNHAWFSWQGETNMLSKFESSDKPL